jgi:hypothetical protein
MKMIGVLGIVTLLAAQTAMAQPPSFRGRSGGATTLLNELIYPCQAACFNTDSSCTAAAQTAALSAIGSACTSDVTAAQTACDTTPFSSACRSAVSALGACAKTDLQTYNMALRACSSAQETCLEACEQPPAAD